MISSASIGGMIPSRTMGLLDKASAFWFTLGDRPSLSHMSSVLNTIFKRCEWALLAMEDSIIVKYALMR